MESDKKNVELKQNDIDLHEKDLEKLPLVTAVGVDENEDVDMRLEGEEMKVSGIDINVVEPNIKDAEKLASATMVDSAETSGKLDINIDPKESVNVNKSVAKGLPLSGTDTMLDEKETNKVPLAAIIDSAEKSNMMEVKIAKNESYKASKSAVKYKELNENDMEQSEKETEKHLIASTHENAQKGRMLKVKAAKKESVKEHKGGEDMALTTNKRSLYEKDTEKMPLATTVANEEKDSILDVNMEGGEKRKDTQIQIPNEELNEPTTEKLNVSKSVGGTEKKILEAHGQEVQATNIEMEEIELNEADPDQTMVKDTVPMAVLIGSAEKKSTLKTFTKRVKVTGLSREELLKVAWTPAWVCTRWTLFTFFCLGWLGMLAGAIVILLQAPGCKAIPKLSWWQKGVVYQIGTIEAFQDSNDDGIGDLAGVEQRIPDLLALNVKGLVIGPIHVTVANSPTETRLKEIDPRFGTLNDFTQLLLTAKNKDIGLVLDITPNYKGENAWFNSTVVSSNTFQKDIKEALTYWLNNGVDGIRVGGVEQLKDLGLLEEWKNVTSDCTTEPTRSLLIVVTDDPRSDEILSLVNRTDCEILSSRYLLGLADLPSGDAIARRIENYIAASRLRWTSWSVGGPKVGHMASLVPENLLRLYHIMLFTLPGTPFTNYGDEIGLKLPDEYTQNVVYNCSMTSLENYL
ncbi:amino acid transporter heavy chain SLC3A2-like [Ambystoma mexicanum]|uniref:amino acid transporter heavy chain SLC3A2-like n=1 Tax=Ambystoma mexicanum TaxID=8296 RepID=UPI0037E77C50